MLETSQGEISLNIFKNSKTSQLYTLRHKITSLPISEGKYDDVSLAVRDGDISMIVKANLQFTKFQLMNNSAFVQVQNVMASCEGALHITKDLNLFEINFDKENGNANVLIYDDKNESSIVEKEEQVTPAQLFMTEDYQYLTVS